MYFVNNYILFEVNCNSENNTQVLRNTKTFNDLILFSNFYTLRHLSSYISTHVCMCACSYIFVHCTD